MPNGPKRNANLRLNARFRVHFTHHVRKCARGLHLSLLVQTFLRNVFKFKLIAVESVSDESAAEEIANRLVERSRIIPTGVKLKVWARDAGRCVTCGATDELHFDHILPFSKGGTSLKAENVQLLCARHNLSKSAKIQ